MELPKWFIAWTDPDGEPGGAYITYAPNLASALINAQIHSCADVDWNVEVVQFTGSVPEGYMNRTIRPHELGFIPSPKNGLGFI